MSKFNFWMWLIDNLKSLMVRCVKWYFYKICIFYRFYHILFIKKAAISKNCYRDLRDLFNFLDKGTYIRIQSRLSGAGESNIVDSFITIYNCTKGVPEIFYIDLYIAFATPGFFVVFLAGSICSHSCISWRELYLSPENNQIFWKGQDHRTNSFCYLVNTFW